MIKSSSVEPSIPVPGDVYLCQTSRTCSCGACCGLYNAADASARSLQAVLAYRTLEFADVTRSVEAILEFQEAVEKREKQQRPFRDFHHCAFIGMIGRDRSRVGCLLHPEAEGNEGVDFRGLSWYGGMACRRYFCPTHRQLPARFKIAVREAAPPWYLYGLIVTEVNMLACFFSATESRLNRKLAPHDVSSRPDWRKALNGFFQLKADWPFRSPDAPGPANYFFEDGLYRCPEVRYPDDSPRKSPFDAIFRSLRSSFDSRSELMAAEKIIENLLRPFSS